MEEKLPTLKVEKIYEDAVAPKKAYPTDAGYDVCAYKLEALYNHGGGNGERKLEGEDLEHRFTETGVFELQCNERVLINTGIKVTVAAGWEIQVRPRSGNALKKGLTVLNSPGTIDNSYRGPLMVILVNTSRQVQKIKLGDAIAQLVPQRIYDLEIELTTLDNTDRGSNGFGSTDEVKKLPNKNRLGLVEVSI